MTASDVVLDLYSVLESTDIGGVYDQTPPKNLDKGINSFVVIDVNNIIPAYDTRVGMAHKAVALINIFVKDKANGIKNTTLIKELTEGVMSAIDDSTIIASFSSVGSTPIKYENFHGQQIIYSILKK